MVDPLVEEPQDLNRVKEMERSPIGFFEKKNQG